MPVDFSSLLADTLKARGFEVEDASPLDGASGASYPVTMVARRDEKEYLVDALASRTVHEEDLQAVASIVDDAGLDGAIVMALEGAQISENLDVDRVDVWDRGDIDRAVGAFVVDRHLEGGLDVDEIGPSPIDTEDLAEPEPQRSSDADTHPNPAPYQPPTSQETDPETTPTQEPAPEPSATPAEEPATATDEPAPASEQPPAATAEQAPDEDTGDDEDVAEPDDVGHRELVDPEDMLERAERLMQEGGLDDGDAELIVEDDSTSPSSTQQPDDASPEPSPETTPPAAEQREPASAEPQTAAEPEAEPVDPSTVDGSDAELLEPEPEATEPERPHPEGEPPEPETASTARQEEPEPEPETADPEPQAAPEAEPSTSPSSESPAAVAGPGDEDSAFVSGATIEPCVAEDEARRKAEEALFDVDGSRLELLPFHVYEYDAVLEGDGHQRPEQGRVWVSTQSGAVVRAPRGDRVDEPEVAHERFQGSLSGPETEQAARDHLTDSLERRDEVRQDYSESAVIERVRLEPDPDSLELELLGKAYAPRWRVDGRNGTVFVDAVTGELVND